MKLKCPDGIVNKSMHAYRFSLMTKYTALNERTEIYIIKKYIYCLFFILFFV